MADIDTIVFSVSPGERRFALMTDDEVLEFAFDRGEVSGAVLLGRVTAVRKDLDAAFVEIGLERAGYLPHPAVGEGETVLVQVTGEPQADKGARLTADVALTGALMAYTPSRPGLSVSRKLEDGERTRLSALLAEATQAGEGLVCRTNAAGAPAEALLAELRALRADWQSLRDRLAAAQPPARLWVPDPLARLLAQHPGSLVLADDDLAYAHARRLGARVERRRGGFEELAGETLAHALERTVPLPGGGSLVIERTAAAITIDVNSGAIGPLDANLAAVTEIARQLRLRGLSGHILVDVIPLKNRAAMARVVEALRRTVAEDPTPTHVVGTTPLGLIEMTRERRRPALDEMLLEPQPERIPSARTLALETLRRVAVQPGLVVAASEIIEAIRALPEAMAEAEARLGAPLQLRAESGRAREDVLIVTP